MLVAQVAPEVPEQTPREGNKVNKQTKQSGFAVVELVVIVVLVVAIVGVGIYVWREHNKSNSITPATTASTSAYQSPPVTTPSAPQITTSSSLNSAMAALNQTSISSSSLDSGQLSNYTSTF